MSFDLDDEELKATRESNGADRRGIENLIEELTKVRPDELSTEGLKLFNKINEIIDKNKELKEENKTLNERNQYLVKYRAKLEKELYESNENYIPVSLVEEKIEEYQNNMKLYENETHNIFNENNIRQEVITVLQELLEKR
jgi:hypothetical protein